MKTFLYLFGIILLMNQDALSQSTVNIIPQNRYDTVVTTARFIMHYTPDIYNSGSTSLNLKFETLQKDYEGSICIGTTCYPDIPTSGNAGNLGAGNSAYLGLSLVTFGKVDSGDVIIRFYESGNESNADTIFVRLVVIEDTLSTTIHEMSNSSEILGDAYPNPSTDHSTIPINIESMNDAVFNIHDSFGKLVLTIDLKPNQKKIELNNFFPTGTYIYSIISNGRVLSAKKIQML